MTKVKKEKLEIYLAKLNSRMADDTPAKHKDNDTTYRNFLKREIRVVAAQLEDARLAGVK